MHKPSVQFSCSVVSDSLRPHGLYPTKFLCPWDFPGKSTGVGCHFLLQEIFPTQGLNPGLPHSQTVDASPSEPPAKSRTVAAKSLQSCPTLCNPHRWQPTRLPRPWDSPGKNTGVGCHFLLRCMKVKSESESEVVSDSV